jgi:single-stranded-DNA-specific exonuclease
MVVFCSDRSALDRRWRVRADPGKAQIQRDPMGVAVTRSGLAVSDEVVQIAARRGAADVAAFLEPSLRDFMPDPSSLPGMDDAVARFSLAIERRETVAVLGDYDVDGATSTAILLRYLRHFGLSPIFHIPRRLEEGYGPNVPAVERLAAEGATLLVIADSGTGRQAFPSVDRARALGVDVIVIDHHEPNEDGSKPDCILVNPKMPEAGGTLAHLCTAGLAFLFLVGVNRHLRETGAFADLGVEQPYLQDLLGLVCLGTVADVVPLKTLNRAYVKLGLAFMTRNVGLSALMEVAARARKEEDELRGRKQKQGAEGKGLASEYACGFVLGPCINAAGRIDDTRLGTLLLSTDDPSEAAQLAERLYALNQERRRMQEEMVESCMRSVEDPGPDDAVLVLYDPSWHPGVVGLGASKVKDAFDRSAVIIGAEGKGSGRSVKGFNIGKAFLRATEAGLLKKGGGHAAAGGLTIDPARLDEFRAFMQEQSRGTVRPDTNVDIAVAVGQMSVEAVKGFEALAPFGMGNQKPRVAFVGGVLDSVRILAEKHVKARLVCGNSQVDLILFNCIGTSLGTKLIEAEGRFVDVLGSPQVNEYMGRVSVQVQPHDVMIGAAATALAAA